MMGIWFTANAIANYLAGRLESQLAGSSIPLYWFLVGSSLGAGVLLLLITPLLKYLSTISNTPGLCPRYGEIRIVLSAPVPRVLS